MVSCLVREDLHMTLPRSIACFLLGGTSVALTAVTALASADTLVVKTALGKYEPGAAASWSASGDALVFVLADDVDANTVATTLTDRLAQIKVALDGKKMTVSGIPSEALLDQLSALSLSGEADPLAALAGLGGSGVAMDGPEAGGSIRASKPTAFPASIFAEHDAAERANAEVVRVSRGEFPAVTLKLRIRTSARTGPMKKLLRRGKLFEAPVLLTANGEFIDLTAVHNQRNLVGFYLIRGDRVSIHTIEGEGGTVRIDWIERR